MWVVIRRAPRQDASYWPGRRWLALIDALAWPIGCAFAIVRAPFDTGVVGLVAMSFALFVAARRCHTALFRNERYMFTTRVLALPLAILSVVGAAAKVLF